jgi:hypothetical protein
MNSQNTDKSYGRFGVRAFSASSAFPVEGALVFIRGKREDGVPFTAAVLETDESGRTPVITLETPPVSASLSPGTGVVPYALYDIEISHRDYYTIITRDVQIYPDTTSILPINMLPLPDTVGTEKYPSSNIIVNNGGNTPNL